jgi:Second Messenger Oligonucleotide or Dinucleotide Synthetase domain
VELVAEFKAFVCSIEPSDKHVAAAKAAHEKVREQLRTDKESKGAHKDTFLSGSYARSTAIHDINDVDVICLLDINQTITTPEVLLSWMEGILARYYEKTRRQGRSIRVLADNNVYVDIVPSTAITADDGPLWIPDREAREWVPTHPKGQIAAAIDKNKSTDGYYVQVVKLMKSWRDQLPTESCRAKSYILETLVHGSIGYPSSHAAAVVSVLEGVQRTYGSYSTVPSISDPGYSKVNVARRWTSGDFNDFMAQVRQAAATARLALSNPDEEAGRMLWRQLFGPLFGQ